MFCIGWDIVKPLLWHWSSYFSGLLDFFTLMMKKYVWRRGEWWFMYCSRLLRGHPSRLSFLRIWKMHRKCVNLTASQYRKSWIFWGIFCGGEVEITTTYPNKNWFIWTLEEAWHRHGRVCPAWPWRPGLWRPRFSGLALGLLKASKNVNKIRGRRREAPNFI